MNGLEEPKIDPFALLSSHPPANRHGFGGSLTLPKLTFEILPILEPIDMALRDENRILTGYSPALKVNKSIDWPTRVWNLLS